MNARSILPKMSELRTVTESVKPDIIAITETWLSSNVPNGAILLPNYNTVARTDRPQDHRGGGSGVLLLIHDSIQWVLRSDLQTWPESAWIEIHLPLSRSQFVIGCVYRPPSSEVEPFGRAMEMTMGTLTDSNALVIGDFNAKCPSWLPSDKYNAAGRVLEPLFLQMGLHQCVESPTHLQPDGSLGSLLDLVLTTTPNLISNLSTLPPLGSSDHLCVTCHLNVNPSR